MDSLRPERRTARWWYRLAVVAAAILLMMALYFGSLFIAHGGNRDFLAIDACLDAGGRWDYERRVCEPGRPDAAAY